MSLGSIKASNINPQQSNAVDRYKPSKNSRAKNLINLITLIQQFRKLIPLEETNSISNLKIKCQGVKILKSLLFNNDYASV